MNPRSPHRQDPYLGILVITLMQLKDKRCTNQFTNIKNLDVGSQTEIMYASGTNTSGLIQQDLLEDEISCCLDSAEPVHHMSSAHIKHAVIAIRHLHG